MPTVLVPKAAVRFRAWTSPSAPQAQEYLGRLQAFMDDAIYPAEPVYEQWLRSQPHGTHAYPPILEELKAKARSRGLWNLFLPGEGHPLSVLDYASLAELTGRSVELAPEAINCAAPDTGNMEVLHLFGTPEQKQRWLQPLLDGEIRSAFAMTEPDVASSDATNIRTSIVHDDATNEWVINGRKWWTSGAGGERCQILIVMGKTDPSASPHRQQSMVLVPMDTPGVTIVGDLEVFGYLDRESHSEIALRQRAGAVVQHHRQSRRRLHDRPGAPRTGPHPPLHAGHRHGRAGARHDDRPGRLAGGVRRPDLRSGRGAGRRSPSRGWRSSRPGCWC